MLAATARNHRGHSTRLKNSALLAAIIAGLAFAAPAGAQQSDDGGFKAYVNTTALNLRAGPGTKNAVLGILLKYDAVLVYEQTDVGRTTWYSVEAPGGYTNGWISARYVEFGESPTVTADEAEVDYGAQETPTLMRGVAQYVGAKACRECHADSTGDYHTGASVAWEKQLHSNAYQTLTRDYTKQIAQRARGVDDPANDWRCLKCHSTAFGADAADLASSYSTTEGVGCEVCHGPGGKYLDADHGPGNPGRAALGFRVLRDLTERREVCASCHNRASPTFIGFDLREFSREIAHWVDKGDKYYYGEAAVEVKRREAGVDRSREMAAKKAAKAEAARQAAAREAANQAALGEDEAAAERARIEVAEREKAKAADAAAAEKKRREAQAALVEMEQRQAVRAAEQKKAAAAAKVETANDPLAKFLEDVKDELTLNTDGVKYKPVKFAHLAHAGKKYLPEGSCNTCHHTQEGNEQPEACSECHGIGGEADEEKAKTRSAHIKGLAYPKAPDQEQISCISCHKAIKDAVTAGTRQGDAPPTKCTACHKRKS